MRNQQGIKLFIVLFICTAFIYSFSHFGALAYNAMTSNGSRFSEGTAVSSLDLSGKTKEEAFALLTEQLQTWRTETTIQLQYKEKTLPIDLGIYHFELENALAAIQDGQKNAVIASIKPKDIQTILKQFSTAFSIEDTEMKKLNDSLLSYALELTPGNYQIQVDETTKAETLNQVEMKLNHVTIDMIDWIAELSPLVIKPKGQLSILNVIEQQKITTMPDSIKSMIATGIYEAILPSNFSIIERHTSQLLPDYAKLGYEANVDAKNNRDFVFVNPNSSLYELELRWQDNTLFITLKGSKFLYDYKVKQSEPQFFKPRTIIQYYPHLTNGNKVQHEGKDGVLIKVSREVVGENGESIRKEAISEDFYPPIHRVEIHRLPSAQTNETAGSVDTSQGTTGTAGENSAAPAHSLESNPETDGDLWGKPNETKK